MGEGGYLVVLDVRDSNRYDSIMTMQSAKSPTRSHKPGFRGQYPALPLTGSERGHSRLTIDEVIVNQKRCGLRTSPSATT